MLDQRSLDRQNNRSTNDEHPPVSTRGGILYGVLVWLLLNPGAATGQPTSTLTAMDYVQIQQLVNRLNFALDYCGSGGRAFADLFVDGGRYVIDRGDGKPTVRDTRDALIALAGGPGCESRRTVPSSYILHLAESLVIEATADGARGTSYAIYPASAGRYLNDDTAGQLGFYHDEYSPDDHRLAAALAPSRVEPAGRGRHSLTRLSGLRMAAGSSFCFWFPWPSRERDLSC